MGFIIKLIKNILFGKKRRTKSSFESKLPWPSRKRERAFDVELGPAGSWITERTEQTQSTGGGTEVPSPGEKGQAGRAGKAE